MELVEIRLSSTYLFIISDYSFLFSSFDVRMFNTLSPELFNLKAAGHVQQVHTNWRMTIVGGPKSLRSSSKEDGDIV